MRRWRDGRSWRPAIGKAVQDLSDAEYAAVRKAVRKGVPPTDPALDAPTQAVVAFTRYHLARKVRWRTLYALVPALHATFVMRGELGLRLGILGIAVAIATYPRWERARLDQLEARISARSEAGGEAAGKRRWSYAPLLGKVGTVSAILLVASGPGVAAWDARPRQDGKLDGPHGAFPAALAAEAPKHPQSMLRSFRFFPVIYEGVAIKATEGTDTVTVSDLRSSAAYWTFTRRGQDIVGAAVDWERGRLMTVWNRHQADNDSTRVTMQDIRTGEITWDRRVKGGSSLSGGVWTPEIQRSVVIPFDRKVLALDPKTGRTRWQIPDDCDHTSLTSTVSTVVVDHLCGADTVDAYDAVTGRRLWSKALTGWGPDDPARPLPVQVGDLGQDRIVAWSRGHEAVYNATSGATIAERSRPTDSGHRFLAADDTDFDNGVAYGTCWVRPPQDVRLAICADDVLSGRRLWTAPYPSTKDHYVWRRSTDVASGRVYSLIHNAGDKELPYRLVVNDARSGALLFRAPLEFPNGDGNVELGGAGRGFVEVYSDQVDQSTHGNPTTLLGDG